MSSLNIIIFVMSIALSLGRNTLSKEISDVSFGSKSFFKLQSVIFAFGFVAMSVAFAYNPCKISHITIIYAIIYSVLLVSAQWCYTAALKDGSISICVTVYSLGFILPTLSGTIFWKEEFTFRSILGTALVIMTIIISGISPKISGESKTTKKYFVPLIVAMLSSGGLGIMQKVQQNSEYANQKTAFVLVAFAIATVFSLAFLFIAKADSNVIGKIKLGCAAGAGTTFGCCNLANTYLAGKFKSSFFFPVQNISVIILSYLVSVFVFREKTGKKEIAILVLGSLAIYFLNT